MTTYLYFSTRHDKHFLIMGFQCQFKESNISITDRKVQKQDCVQFCHVLYHDVAGFLVYCK